MVDERHEGLYIDSDRAYPLMYGPVSPAAERLRDRVRDGAHVSDIAVPESWRRFVSEECGGDAALARDAFKEVWPHLPPPPRLLGPSDT